jgi:hypothetical protein
VGRDHELSWWPASLVPKMYLRLQDYMNRFAGTVSPVHPDYYHFRSGELETVRMLWEGQGNNHKVCSILISASLFSRMHSSRSIYPRDSWPPYTCVSALDQGVNDASGGVTAWHHACTQVIPEELPDHDCKVETLGELVNYFKIHCRDRGLREHAKPVCFKDFESQRCRAAASPSAMEARLRSLQSY